MFTVVTVKEKESQYSDLDVRRAKKARELQGIIGHPPRQKFLDIIDNNKLPGCTVHHRDAIIAEDIYGPDIHGLKGRTTRKANVPSDERLYPEELQKRNPWCRCILCQWHTLLPHKIQAPTVLHGASPQGPQE